MDAKALAAGISRSNGLEFVHSVLHDTKPVGPSYVEGLDTLIGTNGLRRGDIIEIQGLSGSGKTQLLSFLTMTALLPAVWSLQLEANSLNLKVGGKGQSVVWIDCTKRFSVSRIASLMQSHLRQLVDKRPAGLLPPSNDDIEQVVKSSLARLHIFEPSSTVQLAATLQSLPDYCADALTTDLAYLVIEGMSEFSWQDALIGRSTKSVAPDPSIPSTFAPLRHVITSLAHVKRHLAPVTFITQWVLRDTPTHVSSQGHPFYQHHLVSPWPSIGTVPAPPAHGRSSANPLAGPILPTGAEGFTFKYHITTHAPPTDEMEDGLSFAQALARRNENNGKGRNGFVAVLRVAGGREIGSWRFEIGQTHFFG